MNTTQLSWAGWPVPSRQRGGRRRTAEDGRPGYSLLHALMKHGFAGKIYPVTPTNDEVDGLKAYKSIADLPETPDVALIITPAATVPGLIEECGAKGVRNAIVFSAGFEESSEGKELAVRLADAARRHGVTVVGPNCQGLWSVRTKAMLTYSPAALNLAPASRADRDRQPERCARRGVVRLAERNGLGCSYMVSVGNESVFERSTRSAGSSTGGRSRRRALHRRAASRRAHLQIAERARQRGVRIVLLKAGRSELGQQTTASHTGKIASAHAVYADVLDQAGVVSLDNAGRTAGRGGGAVVHAVAPSQRRCAGRGLDPEFVRRRGCAAGRP